MRMSCPHCGGSGIRCCEFGADRGPITPPALIPTDAILITAHERALAHAGLTALLEVWAGAETVFDIKPLPYADQIRELLAKLA